MVRIVRAAGPVVAADGARRLRRRPGRGVAVLDSMRRHAATRRRHRPTSASTPRSSPDGQAPRRGPRGTCRTCRGTRPASSTSRPARSRQSRAPSSQAACISPRWCPTDRGQRPRRHRLAQRLARRPPVRRRAVRARGPVVGAGAAVVRRRHRTETASRSRRNEGGFGRLCVADARTGAVTDVARGVHGQLTWAGDRARRDPHRGAHADPDRGVRHRRRGNAQVLPSVRSSVGTPSSCAEPELITVVARRRRRARPAATSPARGGLLCWVHGGPTDQWQVTFLPRVAYWWSQGWDVLVPDPPRLHGPRPRLPAGAARRMGRPRRRRRRRCHRPGAARPGGAPRQRTVVMGGRPAGSTALGVARPARRLAGGRRGRCIRSPISPTSPSAAIASRRTTTFALVGQLRRQLARYRDARRSRMPTASRRPLLCSTATPIPSCRSNRAAARRGAHGGRR